MTRIVAGVFDDEQHATAAAHELRGAGFDAGELDQFVLGPPGRHGTLPTGGDDRPAPQPRPAGVIVAVNSGTAEDEELAIGLMHDYGARMIERAQGTWRDGRWADFDPVAPPDVIESHLAGSVAQRGRATRG